MFSFLTPYLTIIKGVGALIVVLALWYFTHQYRTGQEAKAQLQQMSQQLADERSCLTGTQCANRIEQAAAEIKKATQAMNDAADEQNRKTKADQDAKEQAAAKSHIQTVKQLQGKLADRDKELALRASHDKPCRDWLNEVLPECVL